MDFKYTKQIHIYLDRANACVKEGKKLRYTGLLFLYLEQNFTEIFPLHHLRFRKNRPVLHFLKICIQKCRQLQKDLDTFTHNNKKEVKLYLQNFQKKAYFYYVDIQLHLESKFSKDIAREILQYL